MATAISIDFGVAPLLERLSIGDSRKNVGSPTLKVISEGFRGISINRSAPASSANAARVSRANIKALLEGSQNDAWRPFPSWNALVPPSASSGGTRTSALPAPRTQLRKGRWLSQANRWLVPDRHRFAGSHSLILPHPLHARIALTRLLCYLT